MDATSFELIVSVSQDARFAATVRELVVCAAQYAGSSNADAAAFGRDVEAAIRASLDEAALETMLPVTVRRRAGPLEVLVNGHTLTLHV
jgi:hypothetical protein